MSKYKLWNTVKKIINIYWALIEQFQTKFYVFTH